MNLAPPSVPRVLIVTRNLPPLVGGMERLNWHLADELSRGAEVKVIGPVGAAALRPDHVEVHEAPLRPLRQFLVASAWRAIRIAHAWRPDVVLAGSGLTAPAAWLAARASGARCAAYLHGLDVAVRHPVYRAIWHPAIRRMDDVIANSRPTAELVRLLGASGDKTHIVHPGVQIPAAPQPAQALQAFRQRHGLGDARLLLSVGRLTERKGLREFVQQSLPEIVRYAPNTLLVVVGDAPTDALLAGVQTRDSIQAAADSVGVGQHLRFLGVVTDDQQLAYIYESASVHVFPVRQLSGDPEGFGMVAIEAAAHGLPTVAFATGGVVDAVSQERSGLLVTPGDYPALASGVLQVLSDDRNRWRASTAEFARQFAWPEFGRQMRIALRIKSD